MLLISYLITIVWKDVDLIKDKNKKSQLETIVFEDSNKIKE